MDLLYGHDKKGTYPDSYYKATANPMPEYPTLDGDMECDVGIVGAGYTGLSAALHLAERGYKVVLLDAQRIGWGASGRNGGQLGSGQRVDQETLLAKVGAKHARDLWQLAQDSKSLVKSLISKHKIDCDLTPGIIEADHKKRFVEETERYVRLLQESYDYDEIKFLDRDTFRAQVGTKAYYGGSLDMGAAHLHPLNLALGLAKAADEAGVQIFEQTRVTEIVEGEPATLKTATGNVRAKHLLLACNGYLGDLEPKVGTRVMPINSYMVATEPLSAELAHDLIANNVAVADSRFVVNYYRLSADKRMLFGGRESYGYRYPEDIAASVRKRMLGIHPQLKDARIDYYWGGALGITMNRMPHVARLAPNILSASGYSGHGLGMSTLCGQLLAEAIAGTAERFDVMAKLKIPSFPGGTRFRRPLLVLAMLYYALRDRF